MKKIIAAVMVASFVSFSIVAMDQVIAQLQVTQEQSKDFSMHLRMATGSIKNMVQAGKVSDKNPIFFALNALGGYLSKSDGDVNTMIEKMNLALYISTYKEVDANPVIQFSLHQVRSQSGDVKAATDYVRKSRYLLSSLLLQKEQPNYAPAFMGELKSEDRIDFLNRNEKYPMEEAAIRAYAALFVYQLVFAGQME